MKKIFFFIMAAILYGCTNSVTDTYNKTLEKVQFIEKSDLSTLPKEKIIEVYNIASELYYDYNPIDLKPEQATACEALKKRVAELKEKTITAIQELLPKYKMVSHSLDDKLFEGEESFPIYLQKGETLHWNITAQTPITVTVSNVDSRKQIKKHTGRNTYTDSLAIINSAIYIVTIATTQSQYIDAEIHYNVKDISRLCKVTPINQEVVECNKNDFGAKGAPGIEMHKCFEEPRKFTLRSQFKATFSGNANALVPVQIPAGTSDILYSIRIDTSEKPKADDGKFHDKLSHSYSSIKFLGLPIYEKKSSSNSSNGILNTLLDKNRPIRDEDAFCNMYVFRNQAQAKQFQDATKKASALSYDVDCSTVGTQSCNGRIPVKGSKTIYLGFENERMTTTNYLWVEVTAIIQKTIYYTTKYSVN